MNNYIPAIATEYGGIVYRSRLEARWAFFFDKMGWKFEYEPFDLNGWIPDFVLYGDDEILVEVKPFSSVGDFDTEKINKATVNTPKGHKEILLLGNTVFFDKGVVHIGWLGSGEQNLWYDKALLNDNGRESSYGFYPENNWWKDRITGAYDGNKHIKAPDVSEVRKVWYDAGNWVRWQPKAMFIGRHGSSFTQRKK